MVAIKRGRPSPSYKPTFTIDCPEVVDLRQIATTNTKATVEVAPRKGPPWRVEAIMDSGSAISFVSAGLARDLRCQVDASRRVEFYDVNGNRSVSAGRARIELTITGKTFRSTFHVAPEQPRESAFRWEMIVGTDFLRASGLIMDFERAEVYRKKAPSVRDKLLIGEVTQKQVHAVVVGEQGTAIDIDPGAMGDVAVRVDELDGDVELARNSRSSMPAELEVIDAVATVRQGCTRVRVRNKGLETVRVYGRQKIAVVEQLAPGTMVAPIIIGGRHARRKKPRRQRRKLQASRNRPRTI